MKRQQNGESCGSVLVTQGGLYNLIRHPMYFADLVVMLGIFLFTGDVIAIGLFIMTSGCIIKQIGYEDQILSDKFGKDYLVWAKRTKKAIPFVW